MKIYIISSEFRAPSQILVDAIQNEIDPDMSTGEGDGIAPIGHVVKVSGVREVTINLGFEIVYQTGYSFAGLRSTMESVVDSYLGTLREGWADMDIVVRSNQLEALLLGITGIMDVISTTINGSAQNFALDAGCIPVRGDIHG